MHVRNVATHELATHELATNPFVSHLSRYMRCYRLFSAKCAVLLFSLRGLSVKTHL